MADNLTETELRENIAEIIKNGDLATLTSKKIRKILEKKYDANLLHRKKQIDDIVMQLVDEQSEDSGDNASAESPSNSGEKSPKEESSEQETKSPVKSERVSVISINNKQKKKVKTESDSDAEEDLQSESDSESDDDAPKPRRKSPLKRSAKNERSKAAKKPKTDKGDGPKRKTGFSKPMLLSPELADLMGETHMPRSEVVKKMWQIIRERDLLDPTNKRFTICDDQLEKIIGKKRFMTFAMMKYLKRHVRDPAIM
ncbi:Upstream activation factor subunit spp27 [Paramuricea clavata]|uniref:Upstream activation factor subunit spp27 n=1 Tax=Paramuricea clavata TaxID=317549 RepID=A0A6S7G0G5_PARCT|nr:Upstream activation factor subunit spp27 [Paramuricea clavata]